MRVELAGHVVCMTLRWRNWFQMANETVQFNFHKLPPKGYGNIELLAWQVKNSMTWKFGIFFAKNASLKTALTKLSCYLVLIPDGFALRLIHVVP